MKKKTKEGFKRFIRHPIKGYKNYIKHTIIPKPYSHRIIMPIQIKKGQKQGSALIPCTIYAMDHSIDLNPALIRKKDNKVVKTFSIKDGQKYKFDSNKYNLKLTAEEEKLGYELSEIERCSHCGQKQVIAELSATRYRSCPLVQVKLADKAKEDVIIPIEYGINKSDITRKYWMTPILILALILVTITITTGFDAITWLTSKLSFGLTIPTQSSVYVNWIIKGIIVIFLWALFIPMNLYGNYKLFKWYNSVKHTLRKVNY